jgi:hypothetical protein
VGNLIGTMNTNNGLLKILYSAIIVNEGHEPRKDS